MHITIDRNLCLVTNAQMQMACSLLSMVNHVHFRYGGMMKRSSSTILLAVLIAFSGIASAQMSSHNTSGVSYRTLGTSGPNDNSTASHSSGASGTAGSSASGSPASTAPDSTGGSRTPGTSASGQKADCPGAIARSAQKDGGSSSTGSGYALAGRSTPSAGADCAAAASGASGSGSKASAAGSQGGAARNLDTSGNRGRSAPNGDSQ